MAELNGRGSREKNVPGESGEDRAWFEALSPEDRARYLEFGRQRAWWLRQVIVNHVHPLAPGVAHILASHANWETGLMYPAQETIAAILGGGARSARSVRACIKALVDGKHLVFERWVHVGGTNASVKGYRWNVWDRRVEKSFDQDALGIRRPGRNLPGQKDGPLRQKLAGSDRLGKKSSAAPAKIGTPLRQEFADEPVIEPESEPATTLLPTPGTDSKTKERKEKELLALMAELLALPLSKYRLAAWSEQLAELAGDGIQADHVVTAVAGEVRRRLEAGRDIDINALTWFRQPAIGVRLAAVVSNGWRDWAKADIDSIRRIRARIGSALNGTQRVGDQARQILGLERAPPRRAATAPRPPIPREKLEAGFAALEVSKPLSPGKQIGLKGLLRYAESIGLDFESQVLPILHRGGARGRSPFGFRDIDWTELYVLVDEAAGPRAQSSING